MATKAPAAGANSSTVPGLSCDYVLFNLYNTNNSLLARSMSVSTSLQRRPRWEKRSKQHKQFRTYKRSFFVVRTSLLSDCYYCSSKLPSPCLMCFVCVFNVISHVCICHINKDYLLTYLRKYCPSTQLLDHVLYCQGHRWRHAALKTVQSQIHCFRHQTMWGSRVLNPLHGFASPHPVRANFDVRPRNVSVGLGDTFTFSPYIRRHPYKLFKHHSTEHAWSNFFCNFVVNSWNSLY